MAVPKGVGAVRSPVSSHAMTKETERGTEGASPTSPHKSAGVRRSPQGSRALSPTLMCGARTHTGQVTRHQVTRTLPRSYTTEANTNGTYSRWG